MKYQVNLETYSNKLIEDLGIMTIEEIRELARGYIGDVFKNEEEINRDMIYIEEDGEEMWLANDEQQIYIIKIKEEI